MTQVNKIRGRELPVRAGRWPAWTSEPQRFFIVIAGAQTQAEQRCRSIAVVHTASHTQTSKATAATLTPTHTGVVWSKRIDRKGGESCSPEERDKELHQIHEVTVLGEGDLWKGKERTTHRESGICFNEADFKTKGQRYTLINMQALD